MPSVSSQNSTPVRSSRSVPATLKLAMGLGGWLAPEATGRHAEHLFTRPLASSQQRGHDSPTDGASLEVLPIGGEQVQVYRWGDASRQPLVVFSHGWSSFGLRVRPWLPALLGAGYAVASFDQIAHGRSSGRHATLPGFGTVLAEVARQLGPVDSLIGHSLGAAAIGLALAQGVAARRVVLIAPPADAREATQRFAGWVGLAEPALRAMQVAVEARAGVPLDAVRAQQVAPQLATPALIIHDLDDAEVPWEEGERYARYWPQSRLLTRSGLGHHRIVGDPGTIDAGLRFLAGEELGERVVSTTALPYGLA